MKFENLKTRNFKALNKLLMRREVQLMFSIGVCGFEAKVSSNCYKQRTTSGAVTSHFLKALGFFYET